MKHEVNRGVGPDDRTKGLTRGKYRVERTDGSSAVGQKHANCAYYVLDLEHDKFARPALLAYADACESEYPLLAKDIRATLGVKD